MDAASWNAPICSRILVSAGPNPRRNMATIGAIPYQCQSLVVGSNSETWINRAGMRNSHRTWRIIHGHPKSIRRCGVAWVHDTSSVLVGRRVERHASWEISANEHDTSISQPHPVLKGQRKRATESNYYCAEDTLRRADDVQGDYRYKWEQLVESLRGPFVHQQCRY